GVVGLVPARVEHRGDLRISSSEAPGGGLEWMVAVGDGDEIELCPDRRRRTGFARLPAGGDAHSGGRLAHRPRLLGPGTGVGRWTGCARLRLPCPRPRGDRQYLRTRECRLLARHGATGHGPRPRHEAPRSRGATASLQACEAPVASC